MFLMAFQEPMPFAGWHNRCIVIEVEWGYMVTVEGSPEILNDGFEGANPASIISPSRPLIK